MKENAKIGYFAHRPSGCYWYRTKQPMEILDKLGVPTQLIHLEEEVSDTPTAYHFYGAYPFSMEKVFKYLKENNKKIVYDTDDALDLIELTNPFYYAVKKELGSVNQILEYCDEITVSTLAMMEYIKQKTDKPITVIPNCFTPSEWTYQRPVREGVRIGFAGSATHVQDLIDIIPVIESLQKKYDVHFIIMGFSQGDYQTWFKEFRYISPIEGIAQLEELDRRLSKIKFEWVPFLDYWNYPSTLINLALDIGLCPLKDTSFNRCRSACKAMEYTLAGALAIASDVEAYRNDENSVLVKENEWESVLTRFIENKEERKQVQLEHLEWTKKHRNIETQFEPLKKVYGVV